MISIARRSKAGQAVRETGNDIFRIVTTPLAAAPEIMQELVKFRFLGALRFKKLAA